jgi:hypothetical protein
VRAAAAGSGVAVAAVSDGCGLPVPDTVASVAPPGSRADASDPVQVITLTGR